MDDGRRRLVAMTVDGRWRGERGVSTSALSNYRASDIRDVVARRAVW